MIDNQTRKDILAARVLILQKQGWILLNQADFSAQLRLPKGNPNGCLLFFLLILAVLPAVIYLILWSMKKEDVITLAVDETGQVSMIRN
jgi:hypothetical protein